MAFQLLGKAAVLRIHARQIELHGGLAGVRDDGLLESALSRAENLLHYGGDRVALHEVVATTAFGLARNHPFLDGNKRTSLVVATTTLALNGRPLQTTGTPVLGVWQSLAAGQLSESALAEWIASNAAPEPR